ncbi:MAG: hypothetical protein M3220_09800 [Chloroflexota bacterium]|nr:hypothetical protein [Chloroflexota bacterium]
MMGKQQRLGLCRLIEDPVLAGSRLLRLHVEDRHPVGMFQMKGVEHYVSNV